LAQLHHTSLSLSPHPLELPRQTLPESPDFPKAAEPLLIYFRREGTSSAGFLIFLSTCPMNQIRHSGQSLRCVREA
jgi:hypothetical protein